jgi:D-erythro-7,8-dihydroneopterin triphosphate epimerase
VAKVAVKNISLRIILGIGEAERKNKQDIMINYEFTFDEQKAVETDNIEYSVNYRTVTKNIIQKVENSQYFLLEKLVQTILDIILFDKKVTWARVTVDKPNALRFAESVSITMEATQK